MVGIMVPFWGCGLVKALAGVCSSSGSSGWSGKKDELIFWPVVL